MNTSEDLKKTRRMERFEKELRACSVLIECVNSVLERYEGKLTLKGNDTEKDLTLLVSAMFGKAGKTFRAVIELCCLGFGEDALVLLRSNINLMINLLYILFENSLERAGDYIAHGHVEQRKYLKLAHNAEPEGLKRVRWNEIEPRASRWKKLTIEGKAAKAKQSYHYDVGYRFYSSIEHSDAMAVSRYVDEKEELGPTISSSPSDNFVDIALIHNFQVMANVVYGFCKHFLIKDADIDRRIDEVWKGLGSD